MSLHEELRTARRCADELTRCVGRLERALGPGIDTRRLRGDADRLKESLALVAAAVPGTAPPGPGEPIPVSEAPYDDRLWTDADDEGVGARRRGSP